METRNRFDERFQPRLFLRLYAEIGARSDAKLIADRLSSHLQPCATVAVQNASPYCKIPAYWAFEFDVTSNCILDSTFDCIVALCPKGWVLMEDPPERSAIWNSVDGAVFLTVEVRWAELALFYVNRSDPDEKEWTFWKS